MGRRTKYFAFARSDTAEACVRNHLAPAAASRSSIAASALTPEYYAGPMASASFANSDRTVPRISPHEWGRPEPGPWLSDAVSDCGAWASL